MQPAIQTLSNIILGLARLIMSFIVYVDTSLSRMLPQAGVSGPAATVVLIAVAIFLALVALKFLGRVFAVLILVLLGLLVLHMAAPGLDNVAQSESMLGRPAYTVPSAPAPGSTPVAAHQSFEGRGPGR